MARNRPQNPIKPNVRYGSKADILQPQIRVMSALPPKADMCSALAHVRFVPIADINGLRPDSAPLQSLRATSPEDLTIAVCIARQVEDCGSRLK